MKITQHLVRQKGVLTELLIDYIDRDSLSIVEEFLDNPVIQIKNTIEYDNKVLRYSRKMRKDSGGQYYLHKDNGVFFSYNSYTDNEKKLCETILKHIINNKNVKYTMKKLSNELENVKKGQLLSRVFNNMIETGLVRFNFGQILIYDCVNCISNCNCERPRKKYQRFRTIRSIEN